MSRRAPAHAQRALALIALLLTTFSLPVVAHAQEPDAFTRALEKGPIFAALAALVGGLLVSLTPCVYPMIAVTVSVFGAKQAKSRGEAMLLSTAFVGGIVVLFTSMLIIAALTGGIFGTALSNRWVTGVIALVFIALAMSMFGAFEMVLPESAMQKLSNVGGIGYGGSFALGLVSGLIAAPCTGPVLTGIILWIGRTQNVVLGAIVGATFALGLGVPFWLVGTFAVALPKAGKWMVWVKSFFGIVMLIVALNFLKNSIPALAFLARPGTSFLGMMAAVVVVGLVLGAVHLSWDDGGGVVKARKGVGIAVTTVGGFLMWAGVDMPRAAAAATADHGGAALVWEHSEKDAVAKALAEKRPLLVDFTAEWCGACKEMARETFADPRVMAKAATANFVAVKVDATNDEDPQIEQVKGKYKVVGLPTVLIIDSTGKEQKRFNEFVGPEPFLKAID
ncbi:MAG TPA: cytochrome c biogenesis protein CcdA, partial [Polyangiaceae bacterium]